ncbi:MAG: hypothetical protein QM656_08235 [Paracoccaceae bacterium]
MSELESRLAALGAAGLTIPYGALARELGLRMGELTAALDQGMIRDAAAGRPFLAAVCRQRLSPDQLPAPGFFLRARELGARITDEAAYAQDLRAQIRRRAQG